MRAGVQVLIGATAAAMFGIATAAFAPISANDAPVATNSKFILSPPELARLQEEALQGSGESAIRVSSYFNFWKNDPAEATKWLAIGAENGSHSAMYSLANMLLIQASPQSVIRARFWLDKVAREAKEPLISDARRLIQFLEKQKN